MGAERPWEKSYPSGVRWDARIATATLPAIFDETTVKWADKPALEYRDRRTSYRELRECFDDLRYGEFMRSRLLGLGSLSMFDATRTPPGKAIAHIWDYAPYTRPDGRSWDDGKADYARGMLERMRAFVSNLDEVLLDYHCDSPVDMERTSPSFHHGDLHGIAPTSWQSGSHRPTPELGQYRVPGVDRLYLVGPFQYPGGGVFGAGRATAQVMCEDLKLDFERVAKPA